MIRLLLKQKMTATLLAAATIVSGTASARVYTPIDSSYKLTFDEEFNGTSLDTRKWNSNWFGVHGGVTKPINGAEIGAYDSAQVSVENGYLVFRAIEKPVTIDGKTYRYRSGMVTSNGKFSQTHGYFEARLKTTNMNGLIPNWPAWWINGQNWPQDGEIDIAEVLDGKMAYHFHNPYGAPGGTPSGDYSGWHVFGVLWEPGSIKYYYDGKLVGTITSNVTSSPMYMILNLGVGGWGGDLKIPDSMMIDYVHVYSKNPNAVAVTPQANYGGPGDEGDGSVTPTPSPSPSPTPVPPVDPAPQGVSVVSASTSPSTIQPGQSSVARARVVSNTSLSNVFVELSIWSAANQRITTQTLNGQAFSAGVARDFSYSFTTSSSLPAGTYDLRVGVFSSNWAVTHLWNAKAATLNVTTASTGADKIQPVINSFNMFDGQTLPRYKTVPMTAQVSDNVKVQRVQFLVNGNSYCTRYAPPYTCGFKTGRPRDITIEVRAFDSSGNRSSKLVRVKIR